MHAQCTDDNHCHAETQPHVAHVHTDHVITVFLGARQQASVSIVVCALALAATLAHVQDCHNAVWWCPIRVVDPAAGIRGRSQKERCQPLRLGADVHKAVDAIVHEVGVVEVFEHHALAMHAIAGAAQEDVVCKESPSAPRVPTTSRIL